MEQRSDGRIVEHPKYNETDFIWFQIEISDLMEIDDTEVSIQVDEFHKRRVEPFPKKLSLIDE